MPETALEIIEHAILELGRTVILTEAEGPTSHTAVVAEGLDDEGAAVALGRYLLGVLAGAVQLDARLSEKYMLRDVDGLEEIEAAVKRVVGTSNEFHSDAERRFRDQTRNAWIGEGLAHALLVVRNRIETVCLSGDVAAITKPHVIPSEVGVDAVAVYAIDDEPFVAIGESKATEKRGMPELRNAARFFADVDDKKYNQQLRSELISLDAVLPPHLAPKVSEAIIRDAACYLPVIVHGDAFDYLADRDWLASLGPPAERRRLLVLRIDDFHRFFDRVADTMRDEAQAVVL
jgi:hypothetical protein